MVEHSPLLTGSKKRRRENDSMERNIVLTNKLEEFSVLWISPPILPIFCSIGSNGDISDRSIEPYIEDFIFKTLFWYWNTPLKVTSNTSFL